MPIFDVLDSMRRRMPWPVGRLILEENDVARGRGWENTVDKIVDNAETEETLTEALRQHVLCGEKLAKFFELTLTEREQLLECLRSIEVEHSVAHQKYPLLLNEEEISVEPRAMKLIAVEEDDIGLSAVFSSIRTNTVRESIDEDELTNELREELSQYEEIIGVRHVRTQAIDVLFVPYRQRHVDLRIDFPQGSISEHAETASNMLLAQINQMNTSQILSAPVNLYPLISHMYNSPNEGKVVELAFGTTTRSLKHEKMRRGAVDLRQEIYHMGGKTALSTPIQPHKISIGYRRQIGSGLVSFPEVTLAGNFREAASANPRIEGAAIRKCSNGEDYRHIRSRLRHFLRQNAPDRP